MNLSRLCAYISSRLVLAVVAVSLLGGTALATPATDSLPLPTSNPLPASMAHDTQTETATPSSEQNTSSINKTANKKKKKRRKKRKSAVRPIAPPARTVQAHEYDPEYAEYNKERADDLLMSAMSLIGVSYRWGGTKPATGLDCSGFIQYVFRQAWGVNLPRTSSEMAKVGMPVKKADLQPGDLVFFSRYGRRVGHVGMYIGNDKFIHSPSTGKKIQIANLNKAYYVKHYVGARRITERSHRVY